MINSALHAGTMGVHNGMSTLNQAAQDIAKVGSAEQQKPIEESIVELKQSEMQVAAAARVVATADKTMGHLIDTFS